MTQHRSIWSILLRGIVCLVLNLVIWYGDGLMSGSRRGACTWTTISSFLPTITIQDCAYPITPQSLGFHLTAYTFVHLKWGLLIVGPVSVATFVACFARWHRAKPGFCPSCDYDLRGSVGSTACPECGRMIENRQTSS